MDRLSTKKLPQYDWNAPFPTICCIVNGQIWSVFFYMSKTISGRSDVGDPSSVITILF